MRVNATFDSDGYLNGYATIGLLENAVDVEVPDDFYQHDYRAYRMAGDGITLDTERELSLAEEEPVVIDSPDPVPNRLSVLEEEMAELAEALRALLRGDIE